MADEAVSRTRLYFLVVDEAGHELPAVEYWAGSLDADAPQYQVVPLRKFVKLLGAGELLEESGEDAFHGKGSGRRFVRVRPPELLKRRA